MKKTVLILAVLLVISVFAGCNTAQEAQTQDAQVQTQDEDSRLCRSELLI